METEIEAKVRVTVYKGIRWTIDWPSGNLVKCLALFNEKLMLIPKEYQNSAQITIDGVLDFDDEPVAEIEIFYFRSPTKEEAAKMEAREEESEKVIRDYELKELERLTEKYKGE